MNGMLQHPDVYREAAERRQHEARGWAQANALGRLSKWAHEQYDEHPTRSRTVAIATPIAVGLGIVAIVI